ncbi:MAG: hypothetical protein V7760_05265 [Marinobacter sp.]
MPPRLIAVNSGQKPDDELFNYINGILNPAAFPMVAAREQSSIAPQQSLTLVWKTIDCPERALVTALFLLGLTRHLGEGRLKNAILKVCDNALKMILSA